MDHAGKERSPLERSADRISNTLPTITRKQLEKELLLVTAVLGGVEVTENELDDELASLEQVVVLLGNE